MFSDMLVGYLKAIASTPQGVIKYQKYNEARVNNGLKPIDTLDQLMKKINDVNQGVTKLSETSVNSKVLNSISAGLEKLGEIEALIGGLGKVLDFTETQKDKYPYAIMLSGTITPEQTEAIKNYKATIDVALNGTEEGLEGFNTLELGTKLDLETFTSIDINGYYEGLTRDMLDSSKTTDQNTLKEKLKSPIDFEETKLKIFKYLNDYPLRGSLWVLS